MTTSNARQGGLRGMLAAAALATGLLALPTAALSATLFIVNNDAAGEGFNDPTPVAPVGGNAGTTLGQQRLIAFQYAANLWGATLTSTVPIGVLANFDPLSCTATSAVLGSAGTTFVFSDFPGAILPGTWYSFALTNKLAGADANPGAAQIRARFNSNLGQANCLAGSPFYLGLDNQHGTAVDLVTVLLHEFGHGLGFQNFTSGSTGQFLAGTPSVWDHYLYDNTIGKRWIEMTAAERAASALNSRNVAWTGSNVSTAVPSVLGIGTPQLEIHGAAGNAAGRYEVGAASFGPPLDRNGVNGQIQQVVDQADGRGLACEPLTGTGKDSVNGKIALVDRGVCGFTVKVLNAQNAGARGVIVVDNVAGTPPPGLGGTDPTITIPAVRVSLGDGNAIKAAIAARPQGNGVVARMGLSSSQYAGADVFGRALIYTPNPFQSGSSVSHWDTLAFPNLLMEPAINGDLRHAVNVPYDLTFPLFRDIGW